MRYRTIRTSATISVTIGRMVFTGRAEFDVIPGEPMVRYYPDGSGYPGSPAEVDDVDFTVDEVEYPFYADDLGADGIFRRKECWAYRNRADLGDCVAIADRWCTAELAGGKYDDELLEDADYPEDDDYDDRH